MDSNMSTAAYVHRAGGSSASSACTSGSSSPGMATANGNGASGGGGRMAVIGVTRNVKLRRRGAAGFGFSLRGGREYAAGFYVSDVVPGGEAHRNGLRVGDQILRVNGYPVEDAVHQEVALLAKNQQVLVLKIRSVGMIPVKDNPNDPVTWHMVQQQQQQLQYGDAVTNEIRIRVIVGEKGRLGCGVCRGIVPGLTVQGTREGGPARAAGLKAGDIIVWCNGQSLTDLPFERAIESMRCASVLDLVVNRPIVNHVYDCPEQLWMRGSSGYDSESSSIAGPSPPPHLASPQHRAGPPCNRNGRNCCPPNGSGPADWGHMEQSQEWMRKQNNTTVIRISPNQQYGPAAGQLRRPMGPRGSANGYDDEEPIYDPVAPREYECHDFDANPTDEIDRRAECRREHGIREFEPQIDETFAKENGQVDSNGVASGGSVVLMGLQLQRQTDKKTVTTVEVHQSSPPAPPSMPPAMPYKWPAEAKPMNAMGMQMGSTMSMGSTGSTETESSLELSCAGKDSASTSSSLSTSSSAGEPVTVQAFAASIAAAASKPARPGPGGTKVPPPPPPPQIDLGTAITQELQRRAKQRSMNNSSETQNGLAQQQQQEPRKPQNPEALRAQEQKVTHDKLMEEFKRAHQRMFSNAQQRNAQEQNGGEQSEESRARPIAGKKTRDEPEEREEEAVEMQSIESFRLKCSPSVRVPKPPPTYFPAAPRINGCASLRPGVSKVAIKFGPYEPDPKQPARLGFLGAATLNRSSPARSNTQGENEMEPSAKGEVSGKPVENGAQPPPVTSSQVDNLATGLNNKVTIRVNPESASSR